MKIANVCHICPDGGTDDQIARYLGEGWTKENVAAIRGIYDSNLEDGQEPLIPEDEDIGKLSDDQLMKYGQKIAEYRNELAQEQLRELRDSTRHPAKAFVQLYAVPGWDGTTRNNRINMVASLFTQALTRRQKALAAQGIDKTREEICNGYVSEGEKRDGQFSIFNEVFFEIYQELKDLKENSFTVEEWNEMSDTEKAEYDYSEEDAINDENTIQAYSDILNNWGALCSFARMRIRDREGIKLGNNLEYAAATTSDDFSIDGELEDSYVLDEAVREAWMVHQSEMSAFSNLGKEVRRFLSTVPVRDENGEIITDDLGYIVYYDPVSTHQHLAERLRGCKFESTMLRTFNEHITNGIAGDPVLRNVGYALLEAADIPKTVDFDPNGEAYLDEDGEPIMTRKFPEDGVFTNMHKPGNPSIITQLLRDMHSNMVPYTALIEGEDGNWYIKRLNNEKESARLDSYLIGAKYGMTVSDQSIFDKQGNVDWKNFVAWYDEVMRMLPPKKKAEQEGDSESNGEFVFANTDVYGVSNGSDFWSLEWQEQEDFMFRSLRALGVNISREEVNILFFSKKAKMSFLYSLSKVASHLKDRTVGDSNILFNEMRILNAEHNKAAMNTTMVIPPHLQDKFNNSPQELTEEEWDQIYPYRVEFREKYAAAIDQHAPKSTNGGPLKLYDVIQTTLGKDQTKPVLEGINSILKAIDSSQGRKGIERRVSWYDRKGKSCSRYSDVTPSYMGDLVDEIKMFVDRGDGNALREFLMTKWGQDPFFYDSENGKFRNMWLQELWDSVNKDGSIRGDSFAVTFEFTEFLGSNIEQNPVNFENFSKKSHAVAMIKNFIQLRDQTDGKAQYADYPSFILGDSGVQRFFRAKHYSFEEIMEGMKNAYYQELERMKNTKDLVESLRKQGIQDEEGNPDLKNMPEGFVSTENVFSTLVFLNPDFVDTKYWREITGDTTTSDEELAKEENREKYVQKVKLAIKNNPAILDHVIEMYMQDSLVKFKDKLCEQGILSKNAEGEYNDAEGRFTANADKLYDGDVEELIKDFYWNTKFATIQQIQMFTVDTAFYNPFMPIKDLQKRYKEIYAPGKGLSIEARDYNGRLYSERKLKDGTTVIRNHEVVRYFKDIELSAEERAEFYETIKTRYKDNPEIIEKYTKSSITDGQGYRTLDSYRAIMGMAGQWTREMERVYERIQELRELAKTRENQSLTAEEVQEIADSMIILQPIKPYMFTLEKVDTGNGKTVLVPVQHKYAEVILIPELMPKGKLRDMALWMEDRGVDLLASTACVKVGAFGACNIKGIEEKDALWDALDKSYPHNLPLTDYRIQSGVPEHLNQDQLFGTQIRKLIYSGIKKSDDYNHYLKNILKQYKGGELEVYIPGAGETGMVKLTGDNVINLYNCLIMANMFDSYEEMEAHSSSKEQLSEMLIQNGIANANQVADVLIGLSISGEGENADFMIPVGDPTMEHDTTGLILSLFKKGVNKQKIKGGSAVQMAPMGTLEDGGLREVCSAEHDNVLYEEIEVTFNPSYTDANGNEVPLRFSDYCFADNFGNHNIGDLIPGTVIDEETGKEVYAIVDKEENPEEWEEYQSYTYKQVNGKWEPCRYDEDGATVIKPKIEVEFPGILDMIAYRIPTERLYSAVNCKIKRFSHPMMGGVLKVPASGTTKAGFDFDIDKLYFFMKDFSMEHFSEDEVGDIWKDIYGIDEKGKPTGESEFPGLFEALRNAREAAENQTIPFLSTSSLGSIAKISGDKDKVAELQEVANGSDKSTSNRLKIYDRLYKYWNSPEAVLPDGKTVAEVYGPSPSDFFKKFVEQHSDKYKQPFDEYDLTASPFENSRTARNNMLIGLMRERLKDKETFKERYTPGGFPKLSSAALDMRILEYGDLEKIAPDGKNVDFKEVDKIHKEAKGNEKKDPEPKYDYSDPSTILIYNQQNQIAAKLIGIFANQNTHHVFCSVLEQFGLTEVIAFGDHQAGLTNFLHKGKDGAEIDVNMAELLAAAVDAVKDPVLNYLNLNLVTADSAAVLFRLGYSQREVGLLFNQPIIKELCEEIANNGTTVEVAINKISKKYETSKGQWNSLDYDPGKATSQQLANNILEGRKIREQGKDAGNQFKEGQLHVLKLFNQIQGVAGDVNSFVQATRFTAANSIGSTWGDIISVIQRTENFAKKYSEQSLNEEKIGNKDKYGKKNDRKLFIVPKALADGEKASVLDTSGETLEMSGEEYAARNYGNPLSFEQCMFDLVRKMKKLFGKYYPHFTSLYSGVRARLSSLTKYGMLDADTINSIHRDIMVFLLGNSKRSDFDGECAISDYPNCLLAGKLTDMFFDVSGKFADEDGVLVTNRSFYTKMFPKLMSEILNSDEGKALCEKSPFFDRLDYTTLRDGTQLLSMKGVGGMQSITSNDIVEAWTDAIKDETGSITADIEVTRTVIEEKDGVRKTKTVTEKVPKTFMIQDLAMAMFYYNFYKLGYNFHATSTMHLTPTLLKEALKVDPSEDGESYVHFVRRVIEGKLNIKPKDMPAFIDTFVKQYILNHLDNYRFTFTVTNNSPVGKYLFELTGMDKGNPPSEFTLNYSTLCNKNYANMLTLQGESTQQHVAFKPVIALKKGKQVYYYMAQSGSTTAFNVAPASPGTIKYVRIRPQGYKGKSIKYRSSEHFNGTRDQFYSQSQTPQTGLPFLTSVRSLFRISRGGLMQQIDHMKGMGIKVHTLREMEIFMRQHPDLFENVEKMEEGVINNDKINLAPIQQAAESGEWNDEAINALKSLLTKIENGEQVFKRFSQRESEALKGVLAQAEALITARSSRNADQAQSLDQTEQRQGEDVILDWAASAGLMVNDWLDEDGHPYDSLELALSSKYQREEESDGSESMIYYDKDSNCIVKACKMEHYQNVQELLDSIALFNATFPETAYEVLGFGYDESGEFRVVLSQPIVEIDEDNIVSEEEIAEYMTNLGFRRDKSAWLSPDGRFKVYDVNLTNVIKTKSGELAVIDADLYFTESKQGFDNTDDIEFLKTPSGDIYGFVHNGEIYMDETKLDPQVPIHEYTHIWDNAVMQSNPSLWERGKRLLVDSKNHVVRDLWNEIATSDQYGKKWESQGKTAEEIENLIMGEVHARLVGEKGAELLEQIEKAEGGKGLIGRLRKWLKDVFQHLAKTFGTWTDDSLSKLTLEDFINMPLRDFVDGVNPNNYSKSSENSDVSTLVIGENGAAAFDAAEEASVRMDNLSVANEMENSGKDALTIKQATGWERGADGKWRYEEMDLKVNKDWFDKIKSTELSKRRELEFKLGDILDTSEISELILQYPLMASLKITVANGNFFDILQTTRGSYNPETNTLMLNFSPVFLGDDVTVDSIRSTLMHELQHIIQTEEGFAEGGNSKVVENRSEMKELTQLQKDLESKEDQLFIEENQDNAELINRVKTFQDYTEEYKQWEDQQNRRDEINRERRKHNQKINEQRGELIHRQALEYDALANVTFSTFDRMFHKNKIKEHQEALKRLNEQHERQLEEFDKANPKQPLLRQEYFFDGPTYNLSRYTFEERDAMREQVRELRQQWKKNSEKYKKLQKDISEIEEKISSTRYNLYSRIAGEVESRAVERRMDLSPEERRNTLFTDEMYSDVAEDDLIFMDANLEKAERYFASQSRTVNSDNITQKSSDRFGENALVNKLKPEYRGKLIFAQEGTGKTVFADNETVFDSDYLLAQILEVSPETASFFYNTLTPKQKEAFGNKLKEAINEKLSQGCTVLTARTDMLNNADVVVYNQNAELTDRRVNNQNRAINQRYSALEYHKNKLDIIKKSRNNNENKEYIELGKDDYLGNSLLSDPNDIEVADSANRALQQGSQSNGQRNLESGLTKEDLIDGFLKQFGITINVLEDYNGELPLFEALDRVINIQSKEQLTDAVGYAIAFMMQSDPEMIHLINMRSGFNARIQTSRMSAAFRVIGSRDEIIRNVGADIARQLREHFGENPDDVRPTTRNRPIWRIIRSFFGKVFRNILSVGKRNRILSEQKMFVADVIEALGRNDFSRIKGPNVKPFTTEAAQLVDIEQAFIDNPFEADIIKSLSDVGIALGGSASIALEGTLYRPVENPLHDIDFDAGDNSSKAQLDKLLPEVFGKDMIAFSNKITYNLIEAVMAGRRPGDATVTYVTLDTPFEVRNHKQDGRHVYEEYYSKDGKYLGKRDGSELYLEDGVKGKLLDFFVGKTNESDHGFYQKEINGVNYLIAHHQSAMAAKILWARPKDMWDYKRYQDNGFGEQTGSDYTDLSQEEQTGELSNGNYRPEFNSDEITYEEEPAIYGPLDMFSMEEWDDLYEGLLESSPLFANQAGQGFFSKQDLQDIFFEPERTNHVIYAEIEMGLKDGSIKPTTIDENQEEIPLCM